MGRGAQADTRSAVDQQLAAQNAYNQQLAAQQEAQRSQIASGYQNLLENPGYTADQQSAISNQSLGTLGSAFAALAQQNQLAFADRARSDQFAALQGLSSLYGVDSSTLARAMGIPPELLNVRQSASQSGPGFFSSLGSSLGQGLGMTGSGLLSAGLTRLF